MPMLRLLLALAITVVLGLASRLYPVGWFLWDRVLGEVLYAVAAYLVLAMLLFRQSPLFIAVLGMALAVGIVIALPLILAVLILIGFIAMAPALGWGLLLAAILIALWSSDGKRRQPR